MNLPRVDAALETCERHLDATGSRATEVEAILTAYVSAVIYASFEAEARAIVTARATPPAGDDRHLANFSKTAAKRLMRSIKVGDLAGVAAWFHGTCKENFQQVLDDEARTAWDNIITNRHGVAHEEDGDIVVISTLTFSELKDAYPKALTVLDCLRASIAPTS